MKIDVVEKDGLFELDLQIHTEEATTITELWSLTDDGCKPTCQTDPDQRARLDPDGVCHGRPGLLHTLARMAADQAVTTGATTLANHLDALRAACTDTGSTAPGLLQGRTGTALALTSAASPSPPHSGWDTCLLLGPPYRHPTL